jgi:hypothetical protein
VCARSTLLSGRLAGLLLADQGAEVFVEHTASVALGLDDAFFDRGKVAIPTGASAGSASADVIIGDGAAQATRAPHQVRFWYGSSRRFLAARPTATSRTVTEDLISAICGFFTNMSVSDPILNRSAIYMPVPLPSVYCGVNAVVAAVAAPVDRQRTGLGRELSASRIAGGLSAIGALTITSKELPPHLEPIVVGGLPPGMAPE